MDGYNIYQRIQRDIGTGNIFSLPRGKLEEYVAALSRQHANSHFGQSEFQGVCDTVRMVLASKITENAIVQAKKENNESRDEIVEKMPNTDIRLFISHSSCDINFVQSLIDLIRAALNIDAEKIRCTSVDGYRLPGGANTNEQLKNEVHYAESFIGVISTESINSVYVVFELGARWGADRPLIPLMAPGTNTSVLGGPLSGINALDSTSRSQLNQLLDELSRKLSLPLQPASSFQRHIETIINLPIQIPISQVGEAGSILNQSHYELVETEGGAIVYKSKTDPTHFACPNCFKNGICILQDRRVVSGIFECPSCKNTYPVKPAKKVGR